MLKFLTKGNTTTEMKFPISNGINKNSAIKLFQVVLVAFLILMPVISFAQFNVPTSPIDAPEGFDVLTAPVDVPAPAPVPTVKLTNPIKADSINGFIKILLEGAIKIAIPIIALAIIYSGFLFVAARGNSEKLTEAKNALLYTLIGAAILLGSWAIAELIAETVLAL